MGSPNGYRFAIVFLIDSLSVFWKVYSKKSPPQKAVCFLPKGQRKKNRTEKMRPARRYILLAGLMKVNGSSLISKQFFQPQNFYGAVIAKSGGFYFFVRGNDKIGIGLFG